MSDHPSPRLPNEPGRAYSAFLAYIALPSNQRSIDRAWRSSLTDRGQSGGNQRAPSHWEEWSSRYQWVERALAFDECTAEQDVIAWLERRKVLREADWQQADELRNIVASGLVTAAKFVTAETKYIAATADQPAQVVTRESFDLSALTRVLIAASKLQRSAVFWPDGDVPLLPGSVLDQLIARELAALTAGRAELAEE